MQDIINTGSVENSWDLLQILSFAKGNIPEGWKNDYQLFHDALLQNTSNSDCK